jgi:hypothetical protein
MRPAAATAGAPNLNRCARRELMDRNPLKQQLQFWREFLDSAADFSVIRPLMPRAHWTAEVEDDDDQTAAQGAD